MLKTIKPIANNIKKAEIGRSKKMKKLPSDKIKDCRKLTSIGALRTYAKTNGAGSKPIFCDK